jgi:hypothetical protein
MTMSKHKYEKQQSRLTELDASNLGIAELRDEELEKVAGGCGGPEMGGGFPSMGGGFPSMGGGMPGMGGGMPGMGGGSDAGSGGDDSGN